MKRCHPMAPQYIYIYIFNLSSKIINNNLESHLPSSCHLQSFENDLLMSRIPKFFILKIITFYPLPPKKKRISFLTPRLDDIDSTITWQQTTWLRNFGHFGKIEGKRLWGFACWNFQTWFGFSMDFWQLHRKGAAFLLHLFFLIPVMSAVS